MTGRERVAADGDVAERGTAGVDVAGVDVAGVDVAHVDAVGADVPSPAVRAALDELVTARARIDRVHADVENVVATLVAASGIAWSGVAADAWRARVGAARRAAGTGLSDLTELRALLERLEGGIGS